MIGLKVLSENKMLLSVLYQKIVFSTINIGKCCKLETNLHKIMNILSKNKHGFQNKQFCKIYFLSSQKITNPRPNQNLVLSAYNRLWKLLL